MRNSIFRNVAIDVQSNDSKSNYNLLLIGKSLINARFLDFSLYFHHNSTKVIEKFNLQGGDKLQSCLFSNSTMEVTVQCNNNNQFNFMLFNSSTSTYIEKVSLRAVFAARNNCWLAPLHGFKNGSIYQSKFFVDF